MLLMVLHKQDNSYEPLFYRETPFPQLRTHIGNPPKIPTKSSGLGIITEAEGWYREACATNASALVGRTFWGLKMGHFKLSKSLAIPCTQTNGKWCWLDSFEMEGATSNSLSFFSEFSICLVRWLPVGCCFWIMATCRSTHQRRHQCDGVDQSLVWPGTSPRGVTEQRAEKWDYMSFPYTFR